MSVAGIDPDKGVHAVRAGARGACASWIGSLNLQCFEHKLAINSPKMYPLYAKCIEPASSW